MYKWENKLWNAEDIEFAPKRKVSNKGSTELNNIIGSMYSEKMGKAIQHESIGEKLFYSLLELDRATIRYYPQPLFIDISHLDNMGNVVTWKHVTDVLVFRNGYKPHLYQVKENLDDSRKIKNKTIDKGCLKYAKNRGWDYSVIYPKLLPDNVKYNIKFLQGYVRKRNDYDKLIPIIIDKLSYIRKININELCKSFLPHFNSVQFISIIYHLIAIGKVSIDINHKISQYSEIFITDDNDFLFNNLMKGEDITIK